MIWGNIAALNGVNVVWVKAPLQLFMLLLEECLVKKKKKTRSQNRQRNDLLRPKIFSVEHSRLTTL